jgi:hypothetical protein
MNKSRDYYRVPQVRLNIWSDFSTDGPPAQTEETITAVIRLRTVAWKRFPQALRLARPQWVGYKSDSTH